jgi:hypothetical protein
MKHLVSLNSEVYFKLRSDYAKSIWPYIDSQPAHCWIEDSKLADLVGRDLKTDTTPQPGLFSSRQVTRYDSALSKLSALI